MRILLTAILLEALLLPVVSFSEPPAASVVKSKVEVSEQKVASSIIRIDGSMVSVDFELVRKKEHCELVLKITNKWHEEITIMHPANMGTSALMLMDENGNVIAPIQLDKDQDIAYEDHDAIKLKPGKTFEYTLSSSSNRKELLSFMSNTGHFAYPLEFGKTYRVVAVYRPAGIYDVRGVCSAEKVIKYEAHLHEIRAH